MKQQFTLFLTLISLSAFCQSVDIDNFWVPISTANLPDNSIAPEKRTYSLELKGESDYTGDDVESKLKMYGWTRTNENPTLDISINVSPFYKGSSKSSNRKEESKDKNGKVLSSTTYYKVTATNIGRATMFINGEKHSYSEFLNKAELEKKAAEKAKKEAEKAAKKKNSKPSKEEKAEKEMADNPFLKNVDAKVEEVVEVEDVSSSSSTKPLVYQLNLDKSYEYATSEYTSAAAASKEFNSGVYDAYNKHANAFKADLVSNINSNLNFYYGFKPINETVRFKRLDSEKHPEFNMFDNATKAMKVIFGKMRYNQDIKVIENDLAPIIEYFTTTAAKLENSDQKHEKRLRAASYYNLAQIYYYLDQHEKVMEIGNKIIASKYDEGDGEKFIKKAEAMKKALTFFNISSRHITPLTPNESADDLGDKVEEDQK